MFEESLLESTPLLHTRNRAPALISFAIQAAVLATLVLIPLLHPEVLPLAMPNLPIIAPRYTPVHTPPPVQQTRSEVTTATTAPSVPAPATRIPQQAFHTDAATVDEPSLAVGLNLGAAGPSSLSDLLGTAPARAPVAVGVAGPPAAKPAASRLHVSTGVSVGHLVAPIRPVYPAIARISRTEGTVIVQAIISRQGRIESAHVVSGPMILQSAALDAVREARYNPFLLNGEPTEVETTISINFRLGS
jgi:protein TonB